MNSALEYKVLTLAPADLERVCRKLEARIVADGVRPDMVLTIAHGGNFVGEYIFPSVGHVATTAQRSSTKYKKGFFRLMMKILPIVVKDKLRIAEAKRLRKHPGAVAKVTLPPLPDEGSLLVVDDAVDSGRTLRAVLDRIALEHPELRVKSAVVTVTTPRPEAMPDYCIFNDGTLVRFPWSADYKEV